MKKLTLLFGLLTCLTLNAQQKPKLVVGIIVDQMRMDYIYRYWDKYSDNGFKRLIGEGHLCKNAHFNYMPTYTGPGHASVYSGSTPMTHGIIANNWYEKQSGEGMYCVRDMESSPLGTDTDAGRMSPKNLLVPSLGDAFRISSNFKGKSIGLSIKDRGAILPAGHSANAAYWFDYASGDFISSSHYMDALPKWVVDFNKENWPDKLAEEEWNTLLDINLYKESTKDNTPYEKALMGKESPVFPYDFSEYVKENGYYHFAASPYGSTVLTKFAEHVIVQEDLGMDEMTDLFALSFSSPDMIGHMCGPQSIEVQDTYLRLDLEIARLLKVLDTRLGEGSYTLFLTADHAAAPVPSYMADNGMPTEYFDSEVFEADIKRALNEEFGEGEWIKNYSNQQFFLNHDLIDAKDVHLKEMFDVIEKTALKNEGVAEVLTTKDLQYRTSDTEFAHLASTGWNPKRSGDVMIKYLAGWMDYGHQGTTHGTSYNYDTHVPLIFFGNGVKPGTSLQPVEITQIVPTICLISEIAFPDASCHDAIIEVIK